MIRIIYIIKAVSCLPEHNRSAFSRFLTFQKACLLKWLAVAACRRWTRLLMFANRLATA